MVNLRIILRLLLLVDAEQPLQELSLASQQPLRALLHHPCQTLPVLRLLAGCDRGLKNRLDFFPSVPEQRQDGGDLAAVRHHVDQMDVGGVEDKDGVVEVELASVDEQDLAVAG